MKKQAKKRRVQSELEKSLWALLKSWQMDLKDDIASGADAKRLALSEFRSENYGQTIVYVNEREFSAGAEDARAMCISDLRSLLEEEEQRS